MNTPARSRDPWLPMIVIAMGQALMLPVFPCGRLPDYRPGEIPEEDKLSPPQEPRPA